jgi:hypothetical protein
MMYLDNSPVGESFSIPISISTMDHLMQRSEIDHIALPTDLVCLFASWTAIRWPLLRAQWTAGGSSAVRTQKR